MLEHLAGVGVRLADAFAEQAFTAANTAWVEPDCHVDPGIPFAAMVRVVRQTLALQAKLEKEERLAAATTHRDPDRRARQTRRRGLVKDAVTEAIRDTADPSDTERLFRDLEDRLDDAEAEERFDDGPIGQVVARICRALGVSIDLRLFEDADVQPGTVDRDAQQRPAERTTSPQSPGKPASFKPDAPISGASKRDTARPAATRPRDANMLAGLPIPGILRPGESGLLEKYLGPPPPPRIPRWPR